MATGKIIFTKSDAQKIRALIIQKCNADSVEQKGILAKIRRLGFSYADFGVPKPGYTVDDFNRLVRSKRIQVI